jgi:sporulenol synthase
VSDVQVKRAIQFLIQRLTTVQSGDGSWRFCFESGVMTDAYMIIILRTLQLEDDLWIRTLHQRIRSKQSSSGAWRVYPDEQEGNLSATVEAYFALLYSGYSFNSDPHIQRAKQFIAERGGITQVDSLMTQIILACCGQYPWLSFIPLPVELILIPSASPIDFYEFSGYARVHLAPVILLADKHYVIKNERTPNLSDLFFNDGAKPEHNDTSRWQNPLWNELTQFAEKLISLPDHIHQQALQKTEKYILDRIEADGTLYSYSSATFLMIFALLSLGYNPRHPVLMRAVHGLKSQQCQTQNTVHIQNSTSTVWDTSLISYALQQAGLRPDYPSIQGAGTYLLSKQHTRLGDWARKVKHPIPGGWGFSDSNTINPDVDDTTAALRAIRRLSSRSIQYREAFNRGLQWVLSMQNDDGGWPAFEKNTDNPLLTMLPLNGADAAAIDPSTADLTGRTLEFLGNNVHLTLGHPSIRRAVRWLQDHQEENGSWYGRWGICYIYGTWCALTGLLAVGKSTEHSSVQRAADWLLKIQNPDGGWGESCRSDVEKTYTSLHRSTLSQSAWAIDALIAVHSRPIPAIHDGINYIIKSLNQIDEEKYPTGAGLPGDFYIRYHSYPYIWPLLTLSHYKAKYGHLL